jgi:OOP family OmpA-OmpF porin
LKLRLRNLLVAPIFLALPLAARAQPVTGVYIGGSVGANFMENQKVVPSAYSSVTGRSYSFDPGFGLTASVGYGFGNGLRVEVQGDYLNNNVDGVNLPVPGYAAGSEQQFGGFLNTLYDFNLNLPVFPYLGVGVGYQEVQLDNVRSAANGFPLGHTGTQSNGNFAYQAIAGISYPLPFTPGLSLTAEYRFVGIPGGLQYARSSNGDRIFVDGHEVGQDVTFNNTINNQILIGLRYAFGTPVPPPPAPLAPVPVAATAPARTYLVFFDWDRADLTPRARQIVAEAADASTHVQTTRIEVNGYTDRSGTPAYNRALSIRRADSVAAELVKDGVPQAVIATEGFGDTNPLIPTEVGVREPQNRRVEIILK